MAQNQIGAKTSFGTIWMNTGNWTGVSFAYTTSYAELTSLGTNFTLMSPSNDFAMTTDGRLKYTGINTRNFNATASIMMTETSGNIAIAVYKNGSLITGAETYVNRSLLAIPSTIVSLSTNDYLSIFAKRSASGTRRIYQIILSAESLI